MKDAREESREPGGPTEAPSQLPGVGDRQWDYSRPCYYPHLLPGTRPH